MVVKDMRNVERGALEMLLMRRESLWVGGSREKETASGSFSPVALNAESYYNNQNLQSSAPLQLKNNHCSLLRKAVGRETGGVLICTGAAGFFRDRRRAGEREVVFLSHLQEHFRDKNVRTSKESV